MMHAGTRSRTWLRTGATALVVMLGMAGAAAAQPVIRPIDGDVDFPGPDELAEVRIDPALQALVDRLGADVYMVREEATFELLESDFDTMQMIALLDRYPLTVEQRHRLLTVLREALVHTPRGAVGISMRPIIGGDGAPREIEVVDLLPGLPAERVLQLGDRIFRIDGEDLAGQESLVNLVQTKRPGDRITMDVRRPKRDEDGRSIINDAGETVYETHEIEIELGSAELLAQPGRRQPAPSSVERRRQRYATEAARRYGPRPRVIDFAPGHEGTFAPSSVVTDEMVDRHSSIRSLMRQRRLLDAGRQDLKPSLIREWNRQHLSLQRKASDSSLAPNDRDYLQRVAERYGELMSRMIQDAAPQ